MLSNFNTESINDVFIITIHLQEARIEQAFEFNKILSDAIDKGFKKVLIDLSEVKFIDSTFLGSLIINLRIICAANGKFKLVGLNTNINTMFIQTNLNNIFEISKTRIEALHNI